MKKLFKNHIWELTELTEERWSVCCLDPLFGENGTDHTQWPSDSQISQWIGYPVSFLDSGDNLDYPEGIFQKSL